MKYSTLADYVASLRLMKVARAVSTPRVRQYRNSVLKTAYEAFLKESGSSLPVKGVRMQPPKLPVMSAGIMGRAPLARKTPAPPVKDPTANSSVQKRIDSVGIKKSPLEQPKTPTLNDDTVYGKH